MTVKQSSRILRGDIYAVPLEGGSWGYVRYWGPGTWGPQLGLFGLHTREIVSAEEVMASGHEFTVVQCSFSPCVRSGKWKWVGRVTPPKGAEQLLIAGMGNEEEGIWMWYLVRPDKQVKLGKKLTPEYVNLEPNVILPGDDISLRLFRGILPRPFGRKFRDLDLPRPDSPAPWLVELFDGK